MRLRYPDVFADAGAMWRGARDVLLPVAAVFFFLPGLGLRLFLPQPDTTGLADEALRTAIDAWLSGAMPWLVVVILTQTYGAALLLLMLLDPGRPTLGAAMLRTLRLIPGLLAAQLIVAAGVALGFLVLIVPGFYLLGRTILTSASYLTSPERGSIAAAVEGFERTRDNGWLLALLWFSAYAVNYLIDSVGMAINSVLVPINHFLVIPVELATAGGSAACVLLLVLCQAAAYRALSVPRQGT